jgi:rare lipoprotein A (peptidoglycan hydrolase)
MLLLIGLSLAGLCGAQAPDSQFGIFTQEGVASWYGVECGGRPTASGELFTPAQLTAAHPTLPFGTMLKVTNKHNNTSGVVRVNDRGPFVSARIIDLSQGAAEQLDMISTGTAPVTVESLEAIALPSNNGRPVRPPTQELLSPPAAPVPRASAASRPSTGRQDAIQDLGTPAISSQPRASAAVPPAPASAPTPAAVSVPETQAPVVADAFGQPVQPVSERPAPIRQNQAVQPFVQSEQQSASQQIAAQTQVQPIQAPTSFPPAEIKPGIPPAGTGKNYRLQVGAYRIPRHAVDAFEKLKDLGLRPAYEQSGSVYRVVLSGIKPEEVESIAGKLGNAGFKEAVIREE